MLPTQLVPDDEGKYLRVRLIQKEGSKYYNPTYLFDEGSTISWIPCGRKLTCSFPGIKMFYGPDTYFVGVVKGSRAGVARSFPDCPLALHCFFTQGKVVFKASNQTFL